MPIELTAHTDAGARLVASAEELAGELAARAAEHDRDGTYPFEAIDALQRGRLLRRADPDELGGLGVDSAHDLVVASSRLARGDASVAIGVNMHLVAVLNMERRRQVAVAAGRGAPRPRVRLLAGADRRRRRRAGRGDQRARAGPHAAGHGRDPHRVGLADRRAQAVLHHVARRDRPVRRRHLCRRRGRRALRVRDGAHRRARRRRSTTTGTRSGMRASGQQLGLARGRRAAPSPACAAASPPATRCRTWSATSPPACSTPRPRSASPSRPTRSPGAASPGASTATRARACRSPTTPSTSPRRAASCIARAPLIDEHRAANPASDGTADELEALFAEAQAAKAFVNEAAARIVDRALALSGGAGYLNGSPLARAYRDVKAGSFMHPLGANRAYDYLGRVALGEDDGAALTWRSGPQPTRSSVPAANAFRDALARFATGVAFVTAAPDGEPAGLIVNSLASVSLDPPADLVLPRRGAR